MYFYKNKINSYRTDYHFFIKLRNLSNNKGIIYAKKISNKTSFNDSRILWQEVMSINHA